jgi:hypothetical protein
VSGCAYRSSIQAAQGVRFGQADEHEASKKVIALQAQPRDSLGSYGVMYLIVLQDL